MTEKIAKKKTHVFLSYCHNDQLQVWRLRQDLIAAGERVWWDGEIKPGQDWKFEIRKAIKNAHAVVLCLSKESEARATSGIYPEAAEAIGAYREHAPGGIFLIPVRLSECEIPPLEIDATRTLDRLQHVDLFPADKYASGVKKLVEAILAAPLYPRQARRQKQALRRRATQSVLPLRSLRPKPNGSWSPVRL